MTILALGLLAAVAAAVHIWVLARAMVYRRDLLKDSTGWERFRDFINKPASENYNKRFYTPEGQVWVSRIWVTAAFGVVTLGAFVFALP